LLDTVNGTPFTIVNKPTKTARCLKSAQINLGAKPQTAIITTMPANPKKQIFLRWQAPEYNQVERHPDWSWVVGILAFVIIIFAIIFKNFLFALIILLGAYSIIALEKRDPSWPEIEISDKGILVGNNFYSYESVKSFWVEDNKDIDVLILHSGRLLFPYIHIYFYEIDPVEVRRTLTKFLPEIKPEENIVDKISEYFGF